MPARGELHTHTAPHERHARPAVRLRLIALAFCLVVLGSVAPASASAIKLWVAFPKTAPQGSVCVVTVRLESVRRNSHFTILLQQREGRAWLTVAHGRSNNSGRGTRLVFRARTSASSVILRVVLRRGSRVIAFSRVGRAVVTGLTGVLGSTERRATTPHAVAPMSQAVAPAATTEPSDQTVSVGQAATFVVAFSGTPSTSVRWQVARSGSGAFEDIPGATSATLRLSNVTAVLTGSRYRAVGVNPAGTAVSNPATLVVYGSTLESGQVLPASQYLTSPSGRCRLVMQDDGNLVLYNDAGRALWFSGTAGNPGAYLAMQASDGNLVIYGPSGTPLWASGTTGDAGDVLRLGDDANLVLEGSDGGTLWQTFSTNHTLADGETLGAPQILFATNHEYQLAMQSDGNLVLYNNFGRAIWASNTAGNPGAYLAMQASDGNLVIYGASGTPLWASGTAGNPGDALQVQADGNLVIYNSSGQAIWNADSSDHTLAGGESLAGAWSQTLYASNRQYWLAMQDDGNLVLYNNVGEALWASKTEGHPGAYLAMQPSDGNLVIYSPSGEALWNSGTAGNPGDALQVQTDGNLVIYASGGNAIWATNTNGGSPPSGGGTGTTSAGEQAAATAESMLGQRTTSNGNTDGYWSGYCEVFVEVAYGGRFRYGSAIADYQGRLAQGLIHSGVPPRGALVFYGGGGGDGHVAISIGGGKVVSTYGYVGDTFPIAEYAYSYFTNPYYGWALPY
jgi:hypothetical protein